MGLAHSQPQAGAEASKQHRILHRPAITQRTTDLLLVWLDSNGFGLTISRFTPEASFDRMSTGSDSVTYHWCLRLRQASTNTCPRSAMTFRRPKPRGCRSTRVLRARDENDDASYYAALPWLPATPFCRLLFLHKDGFCLFLSQYDRTAGCRVD